MKQNKSKSERIIIRADRLIHSKVKALASLRLVPLDDLIDIALLEYFEHHKDELKKV